MHIALSRMLRSMEQDAGHERVLADDSWDEACQASRIGDAGTAAIMRDL